MIHYRLALQSDIAVLVSKRLVSMNIDEKSEDYLQLWDNCEAYFCKAIPEQTCEAVIAEADGQCVGVGILFYYASVPSSFNMAGKNAYISCMYVEPEYRKQGIGTRILGLLIDRSTEKGYEIMMLNSSDMGETLYRKHGFSEIRNGMVRDGRKKTAL